MAGKINDAARKADAAITILGQLQATKDQTLSQPLPPPPPQTQIQSRAQNTATATMFVNTDPTKIQLEARSIFKSNGTTYYHYDNPDSSSSWQWGRWILFALVLVAILVMVFWTNLRRRKRGVDPIVGTSWLAPPPSYGQSQRERYNPNNPQMTQQPLPVYTENVNQNDMGYYDSEGKFVPASVVNPVGEGDGQREVEGYPMTDQQGASSSSSPTDATTTTTTTTTTGPQPHDSHIERPEAAANARAGTTTYTRPAGPPPPSHNP